MILSGADFIDYTVSVTGEAGNVTPTTGSSSFILKVKNPCIDPAYLTIDTSPLPVGETYILHDFDQTSKYDFTHTAFVINADPSVEALCGKLSYAASFESSPIIDSTDPMSYAFTDTDRTFSIYSEDFSLIGDRTITV